MAKAKPHTVGDLRLAALSDDEFSDEEVEQILHETEVRTESDISEVVGILKEYRPSLYERIESEFPLFARREK